MTAVSVAPIPFSPDTRPATQTSRFARFTADVTESQLRRCRTALRRFWLRELKRTNRVRASDAYHRALDQSLPARSR